MYAAHSQFVVPTTREVLDITELVRTIHIRALNEPTISCAEADDAAYDWIYHYLISWSRVKTFLCPN